VENLSHETTFPDSILKQRMRRTTMYEDRIRRPALMNKVMTAEQAALLFKDGMTVGMSGFTRAGDAKALPLALVERRASRRCISLC
jgi:acyl-CoA hydrolase